MRHGGVPHTGRRSSAAGGAARTGVASRETTAAIVLDARPDSLRRRSQLTSSGERCRLMVGEGVRVTVG